MARADRAHLDDRTAEKLNAFLGRRTPTSANRWYSSMVSGNDQKGEETISAWTVQNIQRYECLVRSGSLRTSWRELESEFDEDSRAVLVKPYRCLLAQYCKRVGRLCHPPI